MVTAYPVQRIASRKGPTEWRPRDCSLGWPWDVPADSTALRMLLRLPPIEMTAPDVRQSARMAPQPSRFRRPERPPASTPVARRTSKAPSGPAAARSRPTGPRTRSPSARCARAYHDQHRIWHHAIGSPSAPGAPPPTRRSGARHPGPSHPLRRPSSAGSACSRSSRSGFVRRPGRNSCSPGRSPRRSTGARARSARRTCASGSAHPAAR